MLGNSNCCFYSLDLIPCVLFCVNFLFRYKCVFTPVFCRMLIPKKNRVIIYENLFKEGVAVAKKDFNAPKHLEIEGVPNLQVIKAMQVLKLSRELC